MRAIEIFIKNFLIAAIFSAAITVSACSYKFEEEVRMPIIKVSWAYVANTNSANSGGEILPGDVMTPDPKYLEGTTSNIVKIYVENAGKYYLQLGDVKCTGGDTDGFTIQNNGVAGAELWPNEKQSFDLALTLTGFGEKSSEFTIESTDPDIEKFVFTIRQRATYTPPSITSIINNTGYLQFSIKYNSSFYVRLYRSTDPDVISTGVNIPVGAPSTADSQYFFKDSIICDNLNSPSAGDLVIGTTYYYSMRSCSDNASEASCGDYGEIESFTVLR